MKINQAGKVGAMATAFALSGCGNGAQDVLALKIELTALKQELEFVRQQAEQKNQLRPPISQSSPLKNQPTAAKQGSITP